MSFASPLFLWYLHAGRAGRRADRTAALAQRHRRGGEPGVLRRRRGRDDLLLLVSHGGELPRRARAGARRVGAEAARGAEYC